MDTGSSADVLFLGAMSRMGIKVQDLTPITSHLTGFFGDKVHLLGTVKLPITLGTAEMLVIRMIDFTVVDCPSAYNAILGRLALNKIQAVVSMVVVKSYHQFKAMQNIEIPRLSHMPITFAQEEEAHIRHPHDDPLVISS